MQASLARWAIVSCSLVGMLGCAAGPKPSWWPGRKPNYSNSSTTPPQLPPPQYGQQQPQYDPANGFGATQNPAAGQQYAGNGYPQQGAGGYPPAGAAGYPQGAYPQDYAGAQAPAGQPGYDPAYPQSGGGYADPSYPTNNPYASAGQQADYQNAQQAQPYPGQAAGGYPAGTVNNQYVTGGAGAAAGGMQTADSRYAAGVGAAGGGGYNTDSRYDPGNGQSAGQSSAWGGAGGSGAAAGGAGGAGGAAADPWSGAANSSTYPPSTGGYPDAGGQQDPHYRPGGTGDYSTPTAATGASNAWSQGGSGGAGAGYNAASSPYPSSAGGGAYSGATGQVDRYGQPISGAAR